MRPSGRQTAALRQSGEVVLEDVVAMEVAIMVKMIVDRCGDINAALVRQILSVS